MKYCPNCQTTYTVKECEIELDPCTVEDCEKPTYTYECPDCGGEVENDDPFDYDYGC